MSTSLIRAALVPSLAAALFCSFGVPDQAHAQSADALSCPRDEAAPELRELVESDLLGKASDAESAAMVEQIVDLVQSCSARFDVPAASQSDYGEYTFAALSAEMSGAVLSGAGFDLGEIKRIFEIGEGAANPEDVELSEVRISLVISSALAAGSNIESIPGEVWQMLGVYVAASSDFHRYREGL